MTQEEIRTQKIKNENELILNQLKTKFNNGNNPAGDVPLTLPDSYIQVLNWLSSSFNEDLKSANIIDLPKLIDGIVMDFKNIISE